MSPFMFQKIHSMIVTTYQPTQTKKTATPTMYLYVNKKQQFLHTHSKTKMEAENTPLGKGETMRNI